MLIDFFKKLFCSFVINFVSCCRRDKCIIISINCDFPQFKSLYLIHLETFIFSLYCSSFLVSFNIVTYIFNCLQPRPEQYRGILNYLLTISKQYSLTFCMHRHSRIANFSDDLSVIIMILLWSNTITGREKTTTVSNTWRTV